jgi:hypothetical protein
MGQPSNVSTLRRQHQSMNLLSSEGNNFFYCFSFVSALQQSLGSKHVLMIDHNLNFFQNSLFFSLVVFFRAVKTKIYKIVLAKKVAFKFTKLYTNRRLKINTLFLNQFCLLKKNLNIFTVKIMNKEVNSKLIKFVYTQFKRSLNVLFSRRFNLFIDFIKMTSLFIEKKIGSKMYLLILSQIFRLLPKNKHTRFFLFIKELFIKIVAKKTNKKKKILGVKFLVNGKILGKLRSSSRLISVGSIPIRTISADIAFSQNHVYTLYGVFGFKFWVYYS